MRVRAKGTGSGSVLVAALRSIVACGSGTAAAQHMPGAASGAGANVGYR